MKPVKIFFFILLIASASGCSTNTGNNANVAMNVSQQKTEEQQTVLSNYCVDAAKEAETIRSQQTIDQTIANSEQSEWLALWKQLFMQYNQVDDEYLNDHIRITSADIENIPVSVAEGNGAEYFQIEYDFIVDWIHIPLKDGFKIKDANTEQYRSQQQIIERLT